MVDYAEDRGSVRVLPNALAVETSSARGVVQWGRGFGIPET